MFEPSETGRTIKLALFAGSDRLNAAPIACPDNDKELIQGEFVTVAFPVRSELAPSPRFITIVGAINNGFAVELNVPLKVVTLGEELTCGFAGTAVQVPESPTVSAYVPAKFVSFGGPVAGLVLAPVIVTVSAPAVVGMEITIVTFVPFTVPFGVIETPEASWP